MEKVLYIHGLGSSPKPAKLDLIRNHTEVVALHLDYEQDVDSYKKLVALAKTESVSALIGSSLGGLISYHIAENMGLPCLLFNPALYREVPEVYGMSIELLWNFHRISMGQREKREKQERAKSANSNEFS